MAKLNAGCKRQKIIIRAKKGRNKGKVIAEFMGRRGKSCGPRPKPKTGHLRPWKQTMKEAAKHCKGRSRGAFLNCIATQFPR